MTRMTTRKVRFGLIGIGRIACRQIAPALRRAKHAELFAAASRDLERAQSLKPTCAYDSYTALIQDPDVAAVYIATHNGLHRDLAIAALRHGKHVICEKPLGVNAAECEEMVAEARAANRHLLEAFMYRYHPQIRKAQQLVAAGTIGQLKAVEASFRFPLTDAGDVRLRREWGGGALLDVGCYCVNVSRLFLGGEPDQVTALGAIDPASDVDWSVQGALRFGDGRFAIISCGFDAGVHQRVTLIGTDGVMQLTEPFRSWAANPRLIIQTSGRQRILRMRRVNTFLAEIEDFARAISEGSSPMLPAADSVLNARVLDRLAAAARA